jgi:hypothetical protein
VAVNGVVWPEFPIKHGTKDGFLQNKEHVVS